MIGSGFFGMPDLLRIPAWTASNLLYVIVETPRGARAKLEFDPELATFVLSKSLVLGLSYPYDWGFVPSTLAEDGDPLDAMILHDVATTPGLVLRCKPIGVLAVMQTSKGKRIRNDRIFAVPTESHREDELDDVRELPSEVKDELQTFFKAKFIGWRGPKEAEKLIRKCEKKFKKKVTA
jgi:inorganic pyrophosphatase